MLTIFCDPNYRPSQLYAEIEALLFFYDKIFLYAPSQGQIENAGWKWQRLEKLIRNGFVIPVGRRFWFDPSERESLAAQYDSTSDKAKTYAWSALDEAILDAGAYAIEKPGERSKGYLVLPDMYLGLADDAQQRVIERGDEFQSLIETARTLRRDRRLPNEVLYGDLANAADERVAARMAFYTVGDLSIARDLGAASVYSTPEIVGMYDAVSRAVELPADATISEPFAVTRPSAEYSLAPEELALASRLAKQISDDVGPLDIKLLIEYRDTECSRLFRDFVAYEIESLQDVPSVDAASRELKKRFDAELNAIGEIGELGPSLTGVTVGTIAGLLMEERLQKHSMPRRAFFTVAGALFGLGFARLAPPIATRATAAFRERHLRTLFLLMRQQKSARQS